MLISATAAIPAKITTKDMNIFGKAATNGVCRAPAIVLHAKKRVNQYDRGRKQHRLREAPVQHELEQQSQRIHTDAGRKYSHDGERDRVQSARFLVEAEF